MAIRREATIDDLRRVDGKAEIVGGQLVVMTPGGGLHGWVAGRIFKSLAADEDRTGLGHALPDNVGFVVNLRGRRSFSPDAAFCTQPLSEDFVDGAPIFAVEVRSVEDFGPAAERQLAEKRSDYFAAGTQIVWDVDPLRDEVVRVYRTNDPATPTTYRRGDMAEAEPAVPGWSVAVDDLFVKPYN